MHLCLPVRSGSWRGVGSSTFSVYPEHSEGSVEHQRLGPRRSEVEPVWVLRLNQCNLLASHPSLDLSLAVFCSSSGSNDFEVDAAIKCVTRGECCREASCFVFVDTTW